MGSQGKQAELQEEGKMCGPPCFRSVCGFPLQKAVYIIGLVELTITVIVTIANVVKYSKNVTEDGEFCEGKDGCIVKYLYVFCVSDWTSLEDWVAISYLAFYTAVTLVVVAFTKECGTTEGGVVHDYGAPPAYKA